MKSEAGIKPTGRRQHDQSFKEELIRQSLQPGASVSAIALQAGINANMLFTWRREHLRNQAMLTVPQAATLVPVQVIGEGEPALVVNAAPAAPNRSSRPSVIELEFAGAQLRLKGGVDERKRGLKALLSG